MSYTPADMFATIGLAPALPGARCRGRTELFDPRHDGETTETTEARHRQAIGLCSGCRSFDPCRAWVTGLSPRARPAGVVAGRVYGPRSQSGGGA